MSKVFFISDAHLGADEREKEQVKENRLLAFLEHVKEEKAEVYILGDLFDFFFEYRTVIPARHYRVLEKLGDLVRNGIKVTYIVGNHDFWLGSFFQGELGVTISRDPMEVSLQGKRFFLAHGDGIGNSSFGDRALKSLLRSPISIELFSWIHPDIGAAIARWVSGRSREKSNAVFESSLQGGEVTSSSFFTTIQERPSKEKVKVKTKKQPSLILEEKVQETFFYAKRKFAEGFDGVICGHIHLPKIFDKNGKTFLILGDWIHHFSYGLLHDGKLSLEFFESK
jgi:UDP-2,3-diacylglucosamine hydrolase